MVRAWRLVGTSLLSGTACNILYGILIAAVAILSYQGASWVLPAAVVLVVGYPLLVALFAFDAARERGGGAAMGAGVGLVAAAEVAAAAWHGHVEERAPGPVGPLAIAMGLVLCFGLIVVAGLLGGRYAGRHPRRQTDTGGR